MELDSRPYQPADVSRLGRVPQRCFDLLYASMLGRMPVINGEVGVASQSKDRVN